MPSRVWTVTLFLAVSACATERYPLPLAVGQTHNSPEVVAAELAQTTPPASAPSPPVAHLRRSTEAIDPEVLAILFAAHQREVAQGLLARDRAVDPAVQELADAMVAEHTAALGREVRVAQDLDIGFWDGRISKRMQQDTSEKIERLEALRGANFDKQYVGNVVDELGQLVGIIDAKLLPNVCSLELAARIEDDKENASRRLTEARELQKHLDLSVAAR
jgi:predicted outer membrane protein